MGSVRHYGFNGINSKLRAARRRNLRGTERVLSLHGWRTVNGQIEYVGKGPLGRPPRYLDFLATANDSLIAEDRSSDVAQTVSLWESLRA
jgi:hypothetical protein